MTRFAHGTLFPLLGALVAGGCGADAVCEEADLTPFPDEPAFFALTSDFITSALTAFDGDGALLTEAWVDSGTTRPGLSTALGGDVVLPSTPPKGGTLALIDRSADVLTRIHVPSGRVQSQLRLTPEPRPGDTAFVSNPQDALVLPDGRWLVSRLDPNLNPAATPLDRGNDVLVLAPETDAVVDRIPFDALDAEVTLEGVPVHVYARPESLAAAGSRVVVGLARLSADFQVAGPGTVAILNPETRVLDALPLPGLQNCREVRAVPDDAERLIVACSGPTFADAEGRRRGAGLALVRVTNDEASVESTFAAADHPELPGVTHGLIPLGGTRTLAVAMGDLDRSEPDVVLEVDLASGTAVPIATADRAFVIGSGTLNRDGSVALIPDAERGIRRIATETGRELPPLPVSPCRGLGARQVRRL